ncbi:MAG: GNAT family N-acetyltransferase [Desulfopila sp.]
MTMMIDNPSRRQWQRYVATSDSAIYAHHADWAGQLAATYDLPLFRLASCDSGSGQLRGILPLSLFAPPDGARRLISLPYTDAAGIAADDRRSAWQLLAAALALANRLGANHLELRQGNRFAEGFPATVDNDHWCYQSYNFKTGLTRTLPGYPGQLWADLPAKVRNQVRKARRSGCTIVTRGLELLDDFYGVFAENMRDLGSPVHSLELFHRLLTRSALPAAIILVYHDQKPAAGAVVFRHNGTASNPWASSLRRCRPLCANMLLYWGMLEYAIATGCQQFDFGRSTVNAPTHRFKSQWGARPQPLSWHIFSRPQTTWDPRQESLSLANVRVLELADSRRDGPERRRWISL